MSKFYLQTRTCLTVLFVAVTSLAWSQNKTINGKVTSAEDRSGIPGVNILEKGTSNGTITDVEGNYSITVGPNATLVVTFVGYKTQEIVVGTQSSIPLALEPDVTALSEVVVIGYGQAEKKDITGAMSSLSTKDFNPGVITSPDQLFQGKLSGVQVTSASGEPGAGVNVTIRGASSIRSNNNPLYVVDGFPLDGRATGDGALNDADMGSGSPKNPLNFLNPDDILSIDVLKDASATAIYGSRGANGVVLITTKKGAQGKGSVTYNTYVGVASLPDNRKYDLLDAGNYVDAAVRAGAEESSINFGGATNWQDAIYRNAATVSHALSFGGGSDRTSYRASLSYMDQEGIVKNSEMKRYTARINGNHKFIEDKLAIDFQLSVSNTANSNAPISNNAGYQGSLIGAALQANPTLPVYDANGDFVQRKGNVNGVGVSSDFRNPLAMLAYTNDHESTTRILGNLGVTWTIFKGLDFRVNTGIDNAAAVRRVYYDSRLKLSEEFEKMQGRATIYNRYLNSSLFEGYFNYKKQLGTSELGILAGYSFQEFSNDAHSFGVNNLRSGEYFLGYNNVDGGKSPQPNQNPFASESQTNSLQSFYGRVNYSMNSKYLLTATLRADGSSKFGKNNRYGIFPSVAAGWRLSEEAFIPEAFQDLKLRAGWGITGNQEFPGGISKARYQINNLTGALTLLSTPNPDIKWEQTTQLNVGVDFAVLGGRLSGTVDYFNKSTSDLLIQLFTPSPAPTDYAWRNLNADVVNTGFEFGLQGVIIDRAPFRWNASANLTVFTKNEVKNLGTYFNTGQISGQGLTGAYAQRIADNQPLAAFYMQQYDGINEAGQQVFANGGLLSFVGSPQPDMVYGFSSNVTYKRFDLGLTFNGVAGNQIYNNTRNAIFIKGSLANGRNITTDVANNNENATEAAVVSTRYLESGSFLRLNNVTLGYNLNVSAVRWLSSARLFVTGQNLFVITDYSGYDPEVNVDKSMNGVPSVGIDYTAFPRPRTLTAGVNISF